METKRRVRRLRRAPKVVTVLIVAAISLGAAGVASAACDARIGSQFSNSNPNITVTANNNSVFPAHITVGQYSWGTNGAPNNLGGGYYNQRYS